MGSWNISLPDRENRTIPMKLSITQGASLLSINSPNENSPNKQVTEIKKRLPTDNGGELIYVSDNASMPDRAAVLFRNNKIYIVAEGLVLSPASSTINPSEYIGDWIFEPAGRAATIYTIRRLENGDYVLNIGNRDIMTYIKKEDGSLTPKIKSNNFGMLDLVYDKTINKCIFIILVN